MEVSDDGGERGCDRRARAQTPPLLFPENENERSSFAWLIDRWVLEGELNGRIRQAVGSYEAQESLSMSDELLVRLERLEALLVVLVERQTIKEHYSTDEFARAVGKAEFTVREWARLGRIHAEKRRSGRGPHPAWVIAHAELLRYQKEGLLPAPEWFRPPQRY